MSNLAALYDDQGKFSEAASLYKRVLAISAKVFGPEHADVATIADHLAATLRRLGRDTEEQSYEEQAARIRAKNTVRQPTAQALMSGQSTSPGEILFVACLNDTDIQLGTLSGAETFQLGGTLVLRCGTTIT